MIMVWRTGVKHIIVKHHTHTQHTHEIERQRTLTVSNTQWNKQTDIYNENVGWHNDSAGSISFGFWSGSVSDNGGHHWSPVNFLRLCWLPWFVSAYFFFVFFFASFLGRCLASLRISYQQQRDQKMKKKKKIRIIELDETANDQLMVDGKTKTGTHREQKEIERRRKGKNAEIISNCHFSCVRRFFYAFVFLFLHNWCVAVSDASILKPNASKSIK